MGDAGFFKGTSAEQDARFADKKKKLMKTMKFGDNLSRKVDMSRINLECVRPWIVKRITELLNFEDEVVCDYVFNQLEERHPDPKDIQMNITGFLNSKNARIFLTELWDLLLSAMESPGGIPAEFVSAKKNEIIDRQQQQESRIKGELQRKEDFKAHRKVVMTAQLAATPLISLPHKPEQATISVTSQEAPTGCEPSANTSLAGQSQTEKPGKPSSSKRDRRRRSRSTPSSSSTSSSSRSSASSDYRRRRRRRRHHRTQRRKRSHSRSRSDSHMGKKRILPDSDWRKDLMAGRRRSPPQMPENSYYGNEKHDKQRPSSQDRRHSRDDRDERGRASRTNCDAAGGHGGGGGVGREENDPARTAAWSRQSHNRRRCTESSASCSGDDAEWRNRSPKQQTVPEVDHHHHEAATASMSHRHRPREVHRGREDDYYPRRDYRDHRDRYRTNKHATDWMYEAEEMVAIREENDVSQAKPDRRHQNGQRPSVEPGLPVGSSVNRGLHAAGAVTRGDADMTVANSKPTVAEVDSSSSSSMSSSSSSSSGSDSEDVSSSSDSSVSSDEVAVATGNQQPPPKLQQRQQKPFAASAVAQPRGVTSVPTQSPEGPSLPPTPAPAAKQRKVLPEGPSLPPKPASLDAVNNSRVPAGPLSSSASKQRGSDKTLTKELAAVGTAGYTKSASSDSSDSSESDSESSTSESESDTGSSSGSDSSDSGSSESSSGSSAIGEAAGNDKPPRPVQRSQTQQQQPFSLPGKLRRTLPGERLARVSPEGPVLPPAASSAPSQGGTPVDGESSSRRLDKKSVDKHEEALRRRALASMLRASGDRRRSP